MGEPEEDPRERDRDRTDEHGQRRLARESGEAHVQLSTESERPAEAGRSGRSGFPRTRLTHAVSSVARWGGGRGTRTRSGEPDTACVKRVAHLERSTLRRA
jgi:hypothetical protein